MKIYIIGPSGAGKTTFARKLARKYNIKSYELDCIVYDDSNNNLKRSDAAVDRNFNEILKQESWIIEDVGRSKFSKALASCDKIYYLKISKFTVYIRVIKRWVYQRIGKEKYNCPPTLHQLYNSLKVAKLYYKHEKEKLERIQKYSSKVQYLNKNDLNLL